MITCDTLIYKHYVLKLRLSNLMITITSKRHILLEVPNDRDIYIYIYIERERER